MAMNSLEAQEYPRYYGNYRALVENDQDPLFLGRVQARVYPQFADVQSSLLPWAETANGLMEGAAVDCGEFKVPTVGSWVWVFFEAGDFRQPVVFAQASAATKGQPSERLVNYPHKRVWKTASGVVISVDNQTKEISVSQGPTGAHLVISQDGRFKIGNMTADLVDVLNQLISDLVTYYLPVTAGPAVGSVLYSPVLAADLVTLQTLMLALKGV